MSNPDNPRLNCCVNAADGPPSASLIADGINNRDCGQEEQARLKTGADAIELLHVVLQPAEEKRCTQHEQRIGDDGARDRRLDQHVLA